MKGKKLPSWKPMSWKNKSMSSEVARFKREATSKKINKAIFK